MVSWPGVPRTVRTPPVRVVLGTSRASRASMPRRAGLRERDMGHLGDSGWGVFPPPRRAGRGCDEERAGSVRTFANGQRLARTCSPSPKRGGGSQRAPSLDDDVVLQPGRVDVGRVPADVVVEQADPAIDEGAHL